MNRHYEINWPLAVHFFYRRPILFKEVLHCLPSMMPIQWDPQKNKVYYFDLAFGSTICCCFSSWKLKLFRAVIYENVPEKKWNKQIRSNCIHFIQIFFDYSDTHCGVSVCVCDIFHSNPSGLLFFNKSEKVLWTIAKI